MPQTPTSFYLAEDLHVALDEAVEAYSIRKATIVDRCLRAYFEGVPIPGLPPVPDQARLALKGPANETRTLTRDVGES